MAPEQCLPDGRLGPPTDVFGLAATLYTALTGTRPFPPCEDRFPQLTAAPRRSRAAPRVRSPTRCSPGSTPTRPTAPPPPSSPAALEPLVAALPTRMTLGRR